MANKRGVCAECGKERSLAAWGLCFACYGNKTIRAKHAKSRRGSGTRSAPATPATTPVTKENVSITHMDVAPEDDKHGLLACLVEFAASQLEAAELLGELNDGLAQLREANKTLRLALIKSREEVLLARKALTFRTAAGGAGK
ncbi:MAG TPA: hypothetical protein VM182_10325 [Terriglobia bacterium]|nr:hypothetical protein [Terriglobia bacterium]